MTERTPLRAVRTGVSASVCVAVSACGHTLSSGHEVPFGGLLAGALLILASAWALTGRERGLGTITGWMLWGQLALHTVFTAASAAGHGGHGTALDPGASAGADMLAAHAVAAAVCAWWLRRGEAAVFDHLRLAAAALLPLVLAVVRLPCQPLPPQRPAGPLLPAPAAPLLRHSLVLRGPPLSPR
ncbi:hypothetical protein [Nocardiopsis algeriensis]|uniref:Uncharacterized protein n=1 Tax=Nocardiopsis algeriensis TaxID=1478215 RepID=A0A841IIM7_9ACTN|nr:hypothetical protein [Nocardiopsis algeriensis]MBB6118619.1 hypothetical protein [Nocardiopsis algeriensis]